MKVLSVSIAAYNVEPTLDECLRHFSNCKNIADMDIMIINDGSRDGTVEVAKKYVKKFPNSIRIINKENGGWGSTVNRGIVEAKGKYFKQLDGDDYYDTDNLDRFVDYLKKCDTDIIITPFCHYEDDGGAITKVFGQNDNLLGYSSIDIEEVTDLYPPAMHALTVKTSILKNNKITLMEHCFYTDVEFVIRSLNNSKTISYFELPIYYYRLGRDGQSMSVSGVRKHYKDHVRMLTTMIKYMNKESSTPIMKEIIRRRIVDAVMYQYKFFMALSKTGKHKREMRAFDQELKSLSAECYNQNYGAPIRILRKTNFYGYSILSVIKNYQDKKNEVFLYEK